MFKVSFPMYQVQRIIFKDYCWVDAKILFDWHHLVPQTLASVEWKHRNIFISLSELIKNHRISAPPVWSYRPARRTVRRTQLQQHLQMASGKRKQRDSASWKKEIRRKEQNIFYLQFWRVSSFQVWGCRGLSITFTHAWQSLVGVTPVASINLLLTVLEQLCS